MDGQRLVSSVTSSSWSSFWGADFVYCQGGAVELEVIQFSLGFFGLRRAGHFYKPITLPLYYIDPFHFSVVGKKLPQLLGFFWNSHTMTKVSHKKFLASHPYLHALGLWSFMYWTPHLLQP